MEIPQVKDVREARYPARFSPFRLGFDDALYDLVCANRFPLGTEEWREYNRGVRAAARSRRQANRV